MGPNIPTFPQLRSTVIGCSSSSSFGVLTPEGSSVGKSVTCHRRELFVGDSLGLYQRVTIKNLPDDVLLEIFDFYVNEDRQIEAWWTLVHVCQRWRYIVFASPLRLNLQLLCTGRRPVRTMLNFWPTWPVVIRNNSNLAFLLEGAEDIIASLGHNDRVSCIDLRYIPKSLMDRFMAAMQEPFPKLTHLTLIPSAGDRTMPVALPDSFLGGFAPCLQSLLLEYRPSPALPRVLLSASGLVHLHLWSGLYSEYNSPEVMATCLSTMTRLESLRLGFHYPRHRPNPESRCPPPLARTVLPALTLFNFKGCTDYLEDLVSRLDAPLLGKVEMTFFSPLIFDTTQLLQFIGRTESFGSFCHAAIELDSRSTVTLYPQARMIGHEKLLLGIVNVVADWQLFTLAQFCNSSLPPLSTLERLDIRKDPSHLPHGYDAMANTRWLELLCPFTAVKDLSLSEGLALRVGPALQELTGERVMEVLPALENIFLEGLQPSGRDRQAIEPFVTARQLSGHPVTVHRWVEVQEIQLEGDN